MRVLVGSIVGLTLAVILAGCGSDGEPSTSDETFTGVMTVRPSSGQEVTVGEPCADALDERRLVFQPADDDPVVADLAPGTWSLDPGLPGVHVCRVVYSVTMPRADWYVYRVNDSPRSRVAYEELSDARYEFLDPSQFYAPGTYE